MRLVWSVLTGLVLAAGAVAQELPWYEVTSFLNTSGTRGSVIRLFEGGYYGIQVDNKTPTVLYNRDGQVVQTPFDYINAVDENGTAYGSFTNPVFDVMKPAINGYYDINNGGPFIETYLHNLMGGTKDYIAGIGEGSAAWAVLAKDPNNPIRSANIENFIDSNKAGIMIGADPYQKSASRVFVPGGESFAVKNASASIFPNRPTVTYDRPFRVLEDGGLIGLAGNTYENGRPVRKYLIWDTPDSEPRLIDLTNLSAKDSARIGVIPFTVSGKDGLQLYGANGQTASLLDRIVNPAGIDAIWNDSTSYGAQFGAINSAGFITGSYSVKAEDGSILRYDIVAKPVPEPATIAVIGLGVCGLLGRKRFRSATRRGVK